MSKELCFHLSLFSAQIFTSARSTSSHDHPNISAHADINFTIFLHLHLAVNHCRYVASLGGCSKYSTFNMFCPVYYFIWAMRPCYTSFSSGAFLCTLGV